MNFRWNYVLIVLSFLFGALYFIGTLFGNTNEFIQTWISKFADLWANLLASLIAVLVIEKIIHRARIR